MSAIPDPAPGLVPTGWYPCEVVASAMAGKVLRLRLLLSARGYVGRTIEASLVFGDFADPRHDRACKVIRRMLAAAHVRTANESAVFHHRAIELRLAIEGGENVIVDARSLTREGGR